MQIGFGIALQSTSEQARRKHRRASRYGNLRHSPLNDWCGPSSRGLFEIRCLVEGCVASVWRFVLGYFLDNHHKLAARLLELNDEHRGFAAKKRNGRAKGARCLYHGFSRRPFRQSLIMLFSSGVRLPSRILLSRCLQSLAVAIVTVTSER
jgi:hypothetical protein